MKKAIYTLLFPLAAYLLLIIQADYLHAVAENDLFVSGQAFFAETIQTTGGIWTWLGCYLTQFFHYPWLGALLIVLIWTVTYFLLVDAFKLKGHLRLFAWIPVFTLLVSIVDIGYWLYYMKMPGYWFSQSLSFFAATLLTWLIARLVRLKAETNFSWIIFIIAYFAMCQRFPDFTHRNYSNHLLQLPFVIAPLSVVLFPMWKYIFSHIKADKLITSSAWRDGIINLAYLLIISSAAYLCSFRDANFHSEIRMQAAIENCDWEEVLTEAKAAKNPTNLMVVFKNIALMNTDRLPEMLKTNNSGCLPENGDSLVVRIAQIAGPLVYYHFGQINYAYRWAMENNVLYRPQVRNIKMLVRCAIMNQEFDLAAKYLTILSHTSFNTSWIREHEPMLRFADELYKSEEYRCIAPLMNEDFNALDSDNGLPEQWILSHYADLVHTQNPKQDHLAICAALWIKDEYAFCYQFYNYQKNNSGKAVPELYQQAAIMLGTREDSPINVQDFPFDQLIMARYERFNNDYAALNQSGASHQDIGERMRDFYGDTYWWYYYFSEFKAY